MESRSAQTKIFSDIGIPPSSSIPSFICRGIEQQWDLGQAIEERNDHFLENGYYQILAKREELRELHTNVKLQYFGSNEALR